MSHCSLLAPAKGIPRHLRCVGGKPPTQNGQNTQWLQEDQQQKSTFNADIIGIYLGIYIIIHQYTGIIIEDQWKMNGK